MATVGVEVAGNTTVDGVCELTSVTVAEPRVVVLILEVPAVVPAVVLV